LLLDPFYRTIKVFFPTSFSNLFPSFNPLL
jgi:hypothetical protein